MRNSAVQSESARHSLDIGIAGSNSLRSPRSRGGSVRFPFMPGPCAFGLHLLERPAIASSVACLPVKVCQRSTTTSTYFGSSSMP